MTKREQAHVAALEEQLRLAKALRWSNAPAPDRIPLPESGYVNGWDFNDYQNGKVTKGWTEKYAHGYSDVWRDGTEKEYIPGSQNGRRLYATQLDALIALRMAKELDCAKILANIDRQIDEMRDLAKVTV